MPANTWGVTARSTKGEDINSQFVGARYSTTQEALHVDLKEDAPGPTTMNEEHVDAYIVCVVLVHQCSLKKDLALFDDTAGVGVVLAQ